MLGVREIKEASLGLGLCPAESPGPRTQGTQWDRRCVGDELRRPPFPPLLLLVSNLQTSF